MFKKLLNLFTGILFFAAGSQAQITNYSFTAVSGAYTNITGTSATLIGSCSSATDEGYANAIPLNFNFVFNGITYTTINVSSNGMATFGTAFTGGAAGTACNYDNSAGGLSGYVGSRPILAPFWDDLDMIGGVQYATTGASPNRVFTLQFKNAFWDYSATAASLSFQIKLYETTNVVEFVYNQEAGAPANASGGASIGISAVATGAGNYLSLATASAAPAVSSTTQTTNIGTRPATGQVYRFTPPLTYCAATALDVSPTSGGEKIRRVQMGAIDNTSTGVLGYEDFTSKSTGVTAGRSTSITVTLFNSYFADQVLIWMDLNQDGDFADAGELLYTSPVAAGPFTTALAIPATATTGKTRMRIRLHDTSAGPNATPCGNADWGQVEDYTIYIYCNTSATDPQQTLGEKIGKVQFGTINQSSTSTADYENYTTVSTVIQRNTTTNPITITGAGTYFADQVYVWIDYNQNGSFADAGELVFTSVISAGPYVGNVNVPGTALLGNTTMRVKIQDTQGPPLNSTPCGAAGWGQVEDYTIVFVDCQPAAVTTPPANTTLCVNGNGSISVVATGTGLTYRWQISTDNGATWTNTTNGGNYTGTTTTTLSIINASTSMNGYQYRVLFTGTCTPANFTSSAAILTVNTPPVVSAITTTPTGPLCETGSVTYSVTATGNGPTYQWQLSTNGGGSWTDISGATNSSLTLTGLTPAMNINSYRVVVTVAPCAVVNSAAVALTVNPQPKITIAASPFLKITPTTTTTLTATPNPSAGTYTYKWFRNGVQVSGNANTRVVSIDEVGDWTASVTSSFGCSSILSNQVSIGDSATNQLFVYPNPNRGKFYIRYYTEFFSYNPNPGLNIALIRTINVFDSKGQLMFTRKLSANHSWGRMDVDMTTNAKGTYFIELGDVDGRRLTTTKVVVQ